MCLPLGERDGLRTSRRVASDLTNSANRSAPDAIEASARLAVLAATVLNAAAILNPDPSAAKAASSAILEASSAFSSRFLGGTLLLLFGGILAN